MASAQVSDDPSQLGRYEIRSRLGFGTFATVYQAFDAHLRRDVAIKVLHAKYHASEKARLAFLDEARILAHLDHPGIVPIYDVGKTDDGRDYLVTKLIEGSDLKTRLKQGRLPWAASAEIVAHVAEALHHAHQHGLVHRDVKPGNILLDASGRPMLVDFGLALREENVGQGACYVGTVRYMSPEQARGEGHRVDARSDIYSLGVVFFEMLTGRLPFLCSTKEEMYQRISSEDVPSPRECDASIPLELERICFKAAARRSLDRYADAGKMAEDLTAWSRGEERDAKPAIHPGLAGESQTSTIRVVPHGLRAFGAEDAGFFLDLLPGPRSRGGLPESVQFWKSRLESSEPGTAFRVGVMYGPSGCGKSSLVRAGLLPRLSRNVTTIYLEASADDTETRLLRALRARFPHASPDLGLVELLTTLRRGQGLGAGEKLVLVLDQFEQHLHTARGREGSDLAEALRQCDGTRLQCLILVRDDFWVAVHRFMDDLEVPLVESENTALVDLFSSRHARKVLAEYGRAFHRLPDNLAEMTSEQGRFLDEAVAGLAEDGKIIPVRLCLFAETVKEREWTSTTLRAVGGAKGVGAAFLDEAFGPSAPPGRRAHAGAARAVLAALLPPSDTDLRESGRSRAALLQASGYERKPEAFSRLMAILDGQLRLVTPVAPEGAAEPAAPATHELAYQLTHDYLVPSLRDWLTRAQRETRRGRAQLRLTANTADWIAHPHRRLLPLWWEWLSIHLFTDSRTWNDRERRMMRAANRFHLLRTVAAGLLLLVALAGAEAVRRQLSEDQAEYQARELEALIKDPQASRLPDMRAAAQANRRLSEPRLRAMIANPHTTDSERLLARMVLLAMDPQQVTPLLESLPGVRAEEILELRAALRPYRQELLASLWQRAQSPAVAPDTRLRAACLLADYDPTDARWPGIADEVVRDLTEQNTASAGIWLAAFRPVRRFLIPPLKQIFHEQATMSPDDDRRYLLQRARAIGTVVDALADYAADDPVTLANLLFSAGPFQFMRLWPVFASYGEKAHELLDRELAVTGPADASEESKDALARRKSRAAFAVAMLGHEDHLWPLLRHSPEPRIRGHLIECLAPHSHLAPRLIHRFAREPDVSVRRAILLVLSEYPRDQVASELAASFLKEVQTLYRDDPDPGIHGAAERLLRRWGGPDGVREGRKSLIAKTPHPNQRWFVNSQAQTYAIVPGPVEFWMGSPVSERSREKDEGPSLVRINRSFAVATHIVTVADFLRFRKDYDYNRTVCVGPDSAIIGLTWYDAAQYCRWLSEQDGVPEDQMCYPPVAEIKPGMKLPENFLERTGYRLPTEAEWECACRAGATTMRFYGDAAELLIHYAWYSFNSQGLVRPVGLLLPNDLGLFDAYGNAWQWCQDEYAALPTGATVRPDSTRLGMGNEQRVQKGGALDVIDARLRSAARRWKHAPDRYYHTSGLRPVRTWHPAGDQK